MKRFLFGFVYLFFYLCVVFGVSFSLFTLVEHTLASRTGVLGYFICLLFTHAVFKDFFRLFHFDMTD